jgi:hypothetical protein
MPMAHNESYFLGISLDHISLKCESNMFIRYYKFITRLKNSDSMKLLITTSLTNYLGKCNHKETRKIVLK